MKRLAGIILAACFLFLFAGCSGSKPEVNTAEDLVQALKNSGYTVKLTTTKQGDALFRGDMTGCEINKGEKFLVYEYKDKSAMEQDAAGISQDGSNINGVEVDPVDEEQFYKTGRIMVTYCGHDQTTLSALEKVMGSRFAGAGS